MLNILSTVVGFIFVVQGLEGSPGLMSVDIVHHEEVVVLFSLEQVLLTGKAL